MNTISILVLILAVIFASEAVNTTQIITTLPDAGSFNISGWFDTGFSIGHGRHGRRHRLRHREVNNSTDNDNPELPSIAEVKHFKIPDVFTQAKSTRRADDEPEDNNEVPHHHGRLHHRGHRH